MALYSDFAKKYLTESNFIDKNQAEVTGCPRLSESFFFEENLSERSNFILCN